jgi:hypothetical protein
VWVAANYLARAYARQDQFEGALAAAERAVQAWVGGPVSTVKFGGGGEFASVN